MFKLLERIAETTGWLRIAFSPTLVGLIIAAIIYLPNPTSQRLAIGITIASLGLLIGIVWATKVWKTKKGTVWFLSRVNATPELENEETDTARANSKRK